MRTKVFLDSGAHSLYTAKVIKNKHVSGYGFYESKEFWTYVDDYCNFIKKNKQHIEEFINVDVIFNPEKSWEVQQYIEKEHKLKPIPVVHFGNSFKWLHKYIDAGYPYIGIGGLGQEVSRTDYIPFAKKVFSIVCDTPNHLPKVKTHGFAMTSLDLLRRFPWYSVDSTTWLMLGNYGTVIVPYRNQGKCDYSRNPLLLSVSIKSHDRKVNGAHFDTLSNIEKDLCLQYFEENNTTYTSISNDWAARSRLNALFYAKFNQQLPKWPWPYTEKESGFGL